MEPRCVFGRITAALHHFRCDRKKMVSYCTGSKSGRKDGESIAVFEKRHTGSEREPLQTVFCVKFLVRTCGGRISFI